MSWLYYSESDNKIYIAIPLRSYVFKKTKDAFETLIGMFPIPLAYDEYHNMIILSKQVFKHIYESYKKGKFSTYEYLLFKVADADREYLFNLFRIYEQHNESKQVQ